MRSHFFYNYGPDMLQAQEAVAATPGSIGVAVSHAAAQAAGMDCGRLGARVAELLLTNTSGNCGSIRVPGPDGAYTRLYIRRDGAYVTVGTRADFEKDGCGDVCDHIDRLAATGK